MNSLKTPLCVDLDGTLTFTDTMWEAFFALIKQYPLKAFQLAWLLKRGRGYGKHHIASQVSLIIDILPYNQELLAWIKEEKASGRKIYLVTGSNEKFAKQVAAHVDVFDEVIASTESHPMTGKHKAEHLVSRFGDKQFAYAGNSATDVHVWEHADEAIVVNASASTLAKAKEVSSVTKTIGVLRISRATIFRAIRWHQWIKNLLIFIPALTAHELLALPVLLSSILAFISFSAIASAVYLMNDLTDIAADRKNAYKKHRPIASGKLPILLALKLGLLLGVISFGVALLLPTQFLLLVGIYAIVNIAYSLRLKRVLGVDVMLITSLYVLRILAGSAATSIPASPWLLVFAGLIFLSLALVKRVSELTNLNGDSKPAGRGYHKKHLAPLTYIGITSSAISIAVLAFYMGSPSVQALYREPLLLWLLLPLFAIWLRRVWKITIKGAMHEDPTVFAGKDAISHAIGIAAVIIVFLAT